MTFNKLNRRTHLYLGLLLAPWFFLYAASSLVLNHGDWFSGSRSGTTPEWTTRFEHPYRLPAITDDTDEDQLAEKILKDHGLTGRYRVHFDDDDNLMVLRTRLLSTVRLTYYPEQGRIVEEEKRLRLKDALTAAHFRSGYGYPYWIERLWAVFIDLTVLATLIWIFSGLYIWVKLQRFRLWGWLSIAGGIATFVIVIVML